MLPFALRSVDALTRSLLIGCLVAIGCGAPSNKGHDGSADTGGQTGASGTGGHAGASGTGGRAGASGAGGQAGASGTGGQAGTSGAGGAGQGGAAGGSVATIAGCPMLPANHIFNTAIDLLPVDPQSAAYLATIGTHNLHLDLGTTVDQSAVDFYGIPYNVVHGSTLTWTSAAYLSADTSLDWDAAAEADCAVGTAHALLSPCKSASALQPLFPIPALPIVEGGIVTDPSQPYGDHHILILDADTCRLWELYHAYPGPNGSWDIFGSASFDLRSNVLRPAGWTSADAAGFPILPLLLRADEASSGTIRHALRFTIASNKIRNSYFWPARHLTNNGTASQSLPPMGQLFRLKASYAIPSTVNTQARAILQALKTYGMYIADGGSDMYVTGDPSASWSGATLSQVQSVSSAMFEAVDLSSIMSRAGFSPNSAAVP